MVTEIVKEGSPVRGMYIMGENPVLSDPNVAKAEDWVRSSSSSRCTTSSSPKPRAGPTWCFPVPRSPRSRGPSRTPTGTSSSPRPAIPVPGEARLDLDILIDLSKRLGLPAPYEGPSDVMDEIARVTPSWRAVSYRKLRRDRCAAVPRADRRLHRHRRSCSPTASPRRMGGARLVPVEYLPPAELPSEEFPFVLNTGRQMYHWHTGTMTRRAEGLDSREPVPIVEIAPSDALALGLCEGETVRVTSRRGSVLIGVRISERQAPGQVFIPMHFREAAANLLTNPALDPYAKIAEFKVSAVRVEGLGARG